MATSADDLHAARLEGNDENYPNLHVELSPCGYNKENSSVPSHAGTSHIELEVHPINLRRRKSDNALSVGPFASTEFTENEEENGIQEEDSVFACSPTHTFP